MQVPYRRPTNIGRHPTKYGRRGDLATGICALLHICIDHLTEGTYLMLIHAVYM